MTYRGVISYTKLAEIITSLGLKPLALSEYYNLVSNRGRILLTDKEEYCVIKYDLDAAGWHLRIYSKYDVSANIARRRRVLRDLFLCISQYIELTRRFISDFVYIVDTIFNTNKRNIPLVILTSITNTGRIFLFAYYFIVLELAEAYIFIKEVLTKLIFYNRARPCVVLGDFVASLAAAIGLLLLDPSSGQLP